MFQSFKHAAVTEFVGSLPTKMPTFSDALGDVLMCTCKTRDKLFSSSFQVLELLEQVVCLTISVEGIDSYNVISLHCLSSRRVCVCVVHRVAKDTLSFQPHYCCSSALILYQPFSSAVRNILPHAKAARQLQVICDSPLRAASHEGRSPCLIQAAIGQASHQTSFGNCGISHAKMVRIGWNWYQLVSISKCPPWPTKVYQSAAGMSQNTVPTGTWCLRLDQLRPLMILCQSARGMLGYARHCSPGRKWCCAMLCNCFSSGEILQILEIPDFCVCRRLVAIPCDPFNQIQNSNPFAWFICITLTSSMTLARM